MSAQPSEPPVFQDLTRRLLRKLKLNPTAKSWHLHNQRKIDDCSPWTAMCAEIAVTSSYCRSAACIMNLNFSGILWTPELEQFFAIPSRFGFVDSAPLANFHSVDRFIDAYVWQYGHLLSCGAQEFLAHMTACDMTSTGPRRWAGIKRAWERDFAGRPI